MTKEETKQILTILKINYPQSFKGWTKEQSHDFLDLWAEAFKDDSVQLVISAVKSIIYGDTREFAPNIGQVKNKIYMLVNQDEMTEIEAWNIVKNAVRNGIYGSIEEFEKLPPLIKTLVGSPNELRNMAMMDSQQLNTVVSSNFMRSYKARAMKEKEIQAIPLEIREAMGISTIAEKMKIATEYPKLIQNDENLEIQRIKAEMIAIANLSDDELQYISKFADEYSKRINVPKVKVYRALKEKLLNKTDKKDVFAMIKEQKERWGCLFRKEVN